MLWNHYSSNPEKRKHSQGHVGHHGGSRHQGGVNQVVVEIIYCHVLHRFGLVFDGKSIKMISSTSGILLDNIVDVHIKHKESNMFNMSLSNIFNWFSVKLGQNDVQHDKKFPEVLCHSDLCTEQLTYLRSLAAFVAQRYISCLVHKCEWHRTKKHFRLISRPTLGRNDVQHEKKIFSSTTWWTSPSPRFRRSWGCPTCSWGTWNDVYCMWLRNNNSVTLSLNMYWQRSDHYW